MELTRNLHDLLGKAVVLAQAEIRLEGVVIAAGAEVSTSGVDQVFLTVETDQVTGRIELVPPNGECARWLAPMQRVFDPKRSLSLYWPETVDGVDADASALGARSRPSSLAG